MKQNNQVNIKLLNRQRCWLMTRIYKKNIPECEGILNLLNYIHDKLEEHDIVILTKKRKVF